MHFRSKQTLNLALRYNGEGIVVIRASNDTLEDSYGTVIPVEVLMRDWLAGFMAHRTISSQHALSLRGIAGQPQIGMATRVDFTPQLEVTVRVDDPETRAMLEKGQLTGGSLEFVPLGQREAPRGDGGTTIIFERFSSDPEHCGLSLVDIPSVPGADIITLRADAMLPNWAYAVVDPKILNGEITEPAQIAQLRWYPHHNPINHALDMAAVTQHLNNLGGITVARGASLSSVEIMARGMEHLRRHAPAYRMEERIMNEAQFIALRVSQGATEATAKSEWATAQAAQPVVTPEAAPVTRATEAPPVSSLPVGFALVDMRTLQPVAPQPATPVVQAAAPAVNLDALVQARVTAELERRGATEPEVSMATRAAGIAASGRKLEGNELLAEVMVRSVIPQMQSRAPSSDERQQIDNILRSQGIDTRALTIEGNGTVIYNELARQFAIVPQPSIIARNHWRTVSMNGVNKRTFPRFDRNGIAHQWNRSSAVGAGSTTALTETDPTLDTFDLEVTELNSAVKVPDSFALFNAQGVQFISSVLLPAMRDAAQFAEDRQFFLSTGVHPDPKSFRGLKNMLGGTTLIPSANGDVFSVATANAGVISADTLASLLRALPINYRDDLSKLAFYIPVARADDYGDYLATRQTPGGDNWLQRFANVSGPMPIGVHRGIPIYAVPHLPTNETQGTSTDASTVYLVHKDVPVIGDALTLRIEPYREKGFIDTLQLQEFVGLGYQFPQGIARRAGVRPR